MMITLEIDPRGFPDIVTKLSIQHRCQMVLECLILTDAMMDVVILIVHTNLDAMVLCT
jgi:hypothetical protein